MSRICYNGQFYNEATAILKANNRGYRYGDGFFETLRVFKGRIILAAYHQKRIEQSIATLQYFCPPNWSIAGLFTQVVELCCQNQCGDSGRVRLSISNSDGGLYDENQPFQYLIEAWPLDRDSHTLNINGLTTGFFPLAKKSCDTLANLKSASALLYRSAARFSRQHRWEDCIILNQRENICETTIANLFWIKEGRVFTPALTEGCVDGVMRAYLVDTIGTVTETPCRAIDLLEADEVFITNAIRAIRWVGKVAERTYTHTIVPQLYEDHIRPLF